MSVPALVRLKVDVLDRIAWIAIDNPPLNLLDAGMMSDLDRLGRWLAERRDIRVAVFESANADFFIAHADLTMLADMPLPAPETVTKPSPHQSIVERFRLLPQLTIGKVRGIARGGGCEVLLALDLRYGASGGAILGQPEVPLGFPPGCGATQRLPRVVGRANAIEIIVGGMDYTADEAARMGWLNRSLPDHELDDFVHRLATRVASFSGEVVALAKASIDHGAAPFDDGLSHEFSAFLTAYSRPQSRARLQKAISRGFQTHTVESGSLDGWLEELNQDRGEME